MLKMLGGSVALYFLTDIMTRSSGSGGTSMMTDMKSTVDGRTYRVKSGVCEADSCENFPKQTMQRAANLLATVRSNMEKFVALLRKEYPNHSGIRLMSQKFQPNKILENEENSGLTTYTLDKGRKMAFCIRERDGSNKLHDDINTIMYVAIHELVHLMESHHNPDHKGDFMNKWRFILEIARNKGFWKYHDYVANPIRYCGISINYNVL